MIDYGDVVFAAQQLRIKKKAEPSRPATTAPATEEGLILLIDDSPAVAEALGDVLKLLGYGVIVAKNGQAGVALFEEHQDDVSLVILDMNMPVMNGEETLARLRSLEPEVKIIISSGVRDAEAKRRCAGHDGLHFLHKPYDFDTAREKVEAALAAPGLP